MKSIKNYMIISTDKGYVSDFENGKYFFFVPSEEYDLSFLYEDVVLFPYLNEANRIACKEELLEQGCSEVCFSLRQFEV